MTEQDYRRQAAAEHFAEPVLVQRDASYSLGEHDHPFEAFALIFEGEITLQVGGVRTTYGPGETFRLAPHTPHHEAAGPQGVRYLSARKELA